MRLPGFSATRAGEQFFRWADWGWAWAGSRETGAQQQRQYAESHKKTCLHLITPTIKLTWVR